MKERKSLSERDICTKYITPAIIKAGWNIHSQIREDMLLFQGVLAFEYFTKQKVGDDVVEAIRKGLKGE